MLRGVKPRSSEPDPWLQRWLPLLRERSEGLRVLELGCGRGRDSATLVAAGMRVVGVDLSEKAIADARVRMPAAEFHCQDILDPFPLTGAGAVVASLSLHYFPWPETLALAGRIRETLVARGVLLCRLNSTNDHHFGASGHPAIEAGYFDVDGEPKRFFDEAAVRRMFAAGWKITSLEEVTIDRYEKPKVAWELLAEVG
jgi:SAM-dependent methyltransferase